jgi:uncharacterized repeat protein (TIGR03803 family)
MVQFGLHRSRTRRVTNAAIVCVFAAQSGCVGSSSQESSGNSAPARTYSLGTTINGLNSAGLVLMVDARQRIDADLFHMVNERMSSERMQVLAAAVSVAAGETTQGLVSSLSSGTSYSVTVRTQPTGETCTVAGGNGTIQSASVANVLVTCSNQSYSVSGSISGLNGAGLLLANGPDTLAVKPGATSFTMPTPVAYSSSYAVTVKTQPAGLACAVGNGTGTMPASAVTNLAITCTDQPFSLGGTINGLGNNAGLTLTNGSDTLTIAAGSTGFTMSRPVAFGSSYAVAVQTAPTGLVCSVNNGTGTMGAADVTSVSIACDSNFTLLYSFAGGSSDAADPYHTLIQGSDGDFYGTTLAGGTSNVGTIFKITPSGSESVFYSFASIPYSGLVQSTDGNIYGTTATGGTSGRGTVFKITPSGIESILYSFPAGSSDPYTGLIQGSDGNLYGTTGAGGASDDGTVFKITPSGTETVLHAFPKTGSDGETPYAGLIQGSDGNFYGTTYFGGANNLGAVFKVTPSGTETLLYSFAGGSDGEHPYAGVIQGSDGNFYGTTYQGGASGYGTVFEITPSGTETVLYAFAGGSDGANPEAGVIQGRDGNFYGNTFQGGAGSVGTVFKITPSGSETILHTFAGSRDGANPSANLLQSGDGNLYGSTGAGGAGGFGTFFKVALQ